MKKLISFLKLFVVLFIFSGSVSAQVSQQWVASYNSTVNGDDWISASTMDQQGNIYVTGTTPQESGVYNDYVTIKFNSSGVRQWVATYNGTGNIDEYPSAIAVDASGNVYITGRSGGNISGDVDMTTIKYNSSGLEQWIARYTSPDIRSGHGYGIAVDAIGNVYVAGWCQTFETDRTYFTTIKYNSSGTMQWDKRYNPGETTNNYAASVEVDGSGNVYVTGNCFIWEIPRLHGMVRINTIKYNSNGDELWIKTYMGGEYIPGNGAGARKVKVDIQGNVYIAGYLPTGINNACYATIKYDASGVEQWAAIYDGPGNGFDEAFSMDVDASGNVYVTGYSSGIGTDHDIATIKYNSAGTAQWIARYNGSGNGYDGGYSVAVDGSGNVYVTGESFDTGTDNDYVTIKYNSSGVEQWVQKYNGPGNGYDFGWSLHLDVSGNIYVAGSTTGSGTGADITLLKYSQTPPIVYCGPNNDKILICHKGQELCISPNAVPAHLAHGDKLGPCGDNPEIITNNLPVEFKLNPNYPNPFNPVTKISFDIPKQTFVTLKIYDMLGREVRTLVNEVKAPGNYLVDFNGSELSSGVYFYRLQSADFTDIKRMLLIK